VRIFIGVAGTMKLRIFSGLKPDEQPSESSDTVRRKSAVSMRVSERRDQS
jgi:hypothetical protein